MIIETEKKIILAMTRHQMMMDSVFSAGLDAYLDEQESVFQDVKKDTKKIIIWQDENEKNITDISIVYLHGFSASRQEVSPLLENLAKDLSANIFFTRLCGHGRSNEAMTEVTLDNLLSDAIEGLEIGKKIGKHVILVGTSTGATLATWLAASENLENILGLVLLSPNFGLSDKKAKRLLWPLARFFIPLIEGPIYRFSPENSAQKKYWTCEYTVHALFPMMALVALTNKLEIEKIKVPLLMLYSENDKLLDVNAIKNTFQRFNSKIKYLIPVENVESQQRHVLAGDALSPGSTPFVQEKIHSFVRELLK